MDRCSLVLRRRSQVQSAFQQLYAGASIKQRVLLCFSSSSDRDKYAADSGCGKDTAETQAKGPDKATNWTPGRRTSRRASLSPSARLFAAFSEESPELQHSSVPSRTKRSGSEVKIPESTVDSSVASCDAQSQLLKNGSVELKEQLFQSPQNGNSEEHEKGYGSGLKRRNLSPLKRFSEMIPENYWDESKTGSSVKQDFDDLIKSDDSFKK